ncbi:hypothetical protein JTZ10_21825 [Gordonia rubripertincta]|uniref:Uncharacterized protein n=1 Tax=Gordonia rubripertincta TaxID=36822 RepID=A0AAW4G9P5_GORRU|nr:hypothetical protein [Gordonia rubripertincta]MBM7280388.1 hypothetical protein [Gordonia rubripertincta]
MSDPLDLAAIEARWQPVPVPDFTVRWPDGSTLSVSGAAMRGGPGGSSGSGGAGGGGGGGRGGYAAAQEHNDAVETIAALIARIRELEAHIEDLDEQVVDLTKGY